MSDFFRTLMGRAFYERDVPKIAKQLERIADALEKQNELKEKELAQHEKRT